MLGVALLRSVQNDNLKLIYYETGWPNRLRSPFFLQTSKSIKIRIFVSVSYDSTHPGLQSHRRLSNGFPEQPEQKKGTTRFGNLVKSGIISRDSGTKRNSFQEQSKTDRFIGRLSILSYNRRNRTKMYATCLYRRTIRTAHRCMRNATFCIAKDLAESPVTCFVL